jgi:hypothetical protein
MKQCLGDRRAGATEAWLRQRVAAALALLSLVAMSGCYERVTAGDQSVYRFAWWTGPLLIVSGILSMPAGWYLRRVSQRFCFVLMCMGPFLLFLIAPAMYSDRVVVDGEHFAARYGIWFSPHEHSVRYDDLREIGIVGTRDRRGRTKYVLRCTTKAGETQVIPTGDLVRNTVPEILERARAKGVNVVDERP